MRLTDKQLTAARNLVSIWLDIANDGMREQAYQFLGACDCAGMTESEKLFAFLSSAPEPNADPSSADIDKAIAAIAQWSIDNPR
jgi:exopolyphosphatase/pppGpp-phosphohydrolase